MISITFYWPLLTSLNSFPEPHTITNASTPRYRPTYALCTRRPLFETTPLWPRCPRSRSPRSVAPRRRRHRYLHRCRLRFPSVNQKCSPPPATWTCSRTPMVPREWRDRNANYSTFDLWRALLFRNDIAVPGADNGN